MEPNLNLYEIIGRYMLMMVLVITGGLLHSLPLMLLGLPFFVTGLLGWCPLYTAVGINHATKE
ncbi:MAG: DUF2892 domain-containing protein [Chitinophagales bacterium]|nr:DUF2892 domain-containing protein [Chitinophagales bacterium]